MKMTLSELFDEAKKGFQILFTSKPMEDILVKKDDKNGPQKPKGNAPWCF